MAIHHISSHEQMLNQLKNDQKNYVLLYKSASEASECSVKNIQTAAEKLDHVYILIADVNTVRDIHTHYGVSSAPSLLIFEGDRFINVVKGCNDPVFYIRLFEESYFRALNKIGQAAQKRVIVYTTPSCSWCTTLKNYLKLHNIRYSEVDVSRDQQAAEQMVRRSGKQGVPQTDIEGQIVVGFDKNRINSLLGIQQTQNS